MTLLKLLFGSTFWQWKSVHVTQFQLLNCIACQASLRSVSMSECGNQNLKTCCMHETVKYFFFINMISLRNWLHSNVFRTPTRKWYANLLNALVIKGYASLLNALVIKYPYIGDPVSLPFYHSWSSSPRMHCPRKALNWDELPQQKNLSFPSTACFSPDVWPWSQSFHKGWILPNCLINLWRHWECLHSSFHHPLFCTVLSSPVKDSWSTTAW